MSSVHASVPPAMDGDPGPSPKRTFPAALVPPAEPAADPLEVRPLLELRPVPPQRRPRNGHPPGARRPARSIPVYDPYTARRRRAPEWLVGYVTLLVAGDLAAGGVGVTLALTVRVPGGPLPHLAAAAAVAGWPILLALLGTYAERRQGTGADEYRRVLVSGLVAVTVAAFGVSVLPAMARLVVVGAPAATAATLAVRALARHRLHRARRRGDMAKDVLLVGRPLAVLDLARRLDRDVTAGLRVVGACVPPTSDAGCLARSGVSVLGGLRDVVPLLDQVRPDAVLVASASETAGEYLRELSWRLEGTNIELLVSPGVIEVVPARLQVRPTTSLPLLQIREPEFRGWRRLLKAALDWIVAALLLLALSPGFAVLAVVITATSPGPVFYRHRRIGKRGRQFDLLKFRSMVAGADASFDKLLLFNEGNAVQFKLRDDPRVTRVGRFLRRYSLDELPQLINVLRGEMSLVGPRPHVTREVERYGPDMQRRLLVKPGITGLWQVSGRSDLNWEEAVELDVRYVENWSIALDLSILWRTFRAVVRSAGAY